MDMATEEMGEIDDIHSKEEGEPILNGDVSMDDEDSRTSVKKSSINSDTDQMEVDDDENQDDGSNDDEDNNENEIEANSDANSVNTEEPDNNETEPEEKIDEKESDDEGEDTVDSLTAQKDDEEEEKEDEEQEEQKQEEGKQEEDIDEKAQESTDDKENENEECIDNKIDDNENNEDRDKETKDNNENDDKNKDKIIEQNGKHDEIHEILDDDDDDDDDDNDQNKVIELDDSGGEEGDDVLIIEPKENGTLEKQRRTSDELEVIELDDSASTTTPPVNKKKKSQSQPSTTVPTRRSTRNINKNRSYVESDKEDDSPLPHSSEESDVEEIVPQDPLAVNDHHHHQHHHHLDIKKSTQHHQKSNSSSSSSTIVVKDTKRLVEIAAKSNSNNSGNKKEPTLVIIDTNSILSGRGPVPVNKSNNSNSNSNNYSTILPMALPAQGMYPPNMRATITPIPINNSNSTLSKGSVTISAAPPSMSSSQSSLLSQAPVLPTLTDDMFVVEAPSFIVPYVYEKPPVKDFKEFVHDIKKEILKLDKERKQEKDKLKDKDKKDDDKSEDDKTNKDDDDEPMEVDDKNSTSSKEDLTIDDDKKPYDYFASPLGKFFIDIGFNLVQEYVQSDLLRQQKRKRDREGGHNPTTNKTIHSLIKDLEFSKENNEPFKIPMKKCEFCSFKTESALALAHHLETPHMKNYVYKCNFCSYEIRSPHDILFHMEAEHAVRGRLERAPAFHQCPNCPFEDNQKGKLSRHLVACMRKFKPEKNLEPPIDWEPPAKIPRVPKTRPGLNVSAYQAMKNTQLQFLSKMQLLNATGGASSMQINRGRGRPALNTPTSMKGQTIMRPSGMVYKQQSLTGGSVLVPTNYQLSGNQLYQPNQSKNKSVHQPSISITPLPRQSSSPSSNSSSLSSSTASKPGDINSKNSFVICEICDGYIKDLEQLRNHMQWIHKVKIHPKMIYNRPPLNCQKCQFRFFTDQGLERHLLGSHGLVTSSMQDAANKSKDAGRCPVCGRVYQWKLLNHVARDHNMTLKPAHLSYKCTVCTATFGMYKQFENHVYSAHSVVAKRVMDKKNSGSGGTASSSNSNSGGGGGNTNNKSDQSSQLMKPLKINDEITIIPQPAKPITNSGSTPSTSKNAEITTTTTTSSSSLSSSLLSSSLPNNDGESTMAPSSSSAAAANGAI